jgi:thymidylate synthase
MWNQRSCDFPLGIPFNVASYGLLLEIISKEVNMVPDELIGNLGDCHIYVNQIDGVRQQLDRIPYELPTLDIHPGVLDSNLEAFESDMFVIKNYKCHPSIKMPLSN